MRVLPALCLAFALGLTALSAAQEGDRAAGEKPADKPAPKPAAKNLDDDVLKLLADDADVDLAPKKGVPKSGDAKQDEPKKAPELPGLDAKLTEELETDITPDDTDPIARIGEQMRRVQRQIAQAQSGAATQTAQHKIVNELEEILKQLEQQQKQKQKQGSNSKQPQNSERQKASQPQKQPGANQGNGQDGKREENEKPAKESTDKVGKEQRPPAAGQQRIGDLLSDRAVWGHLPEHERQVLIQAAKLQFLNEYRQLIEDYYSRLANPGKE